LSDVMNNWPLPYVPANNDRVVLASQGIRLWTAECRVGLFNGNLKLACLDRMTLENLRRQQRVAFTIFISDLVHSIQGSGIVRNTENTNNGNQLIEIEPYRLSLGSEQTYELKLSGWTTVSAGTPPDFSRLSFWYQAFRAVTLPMSVLPVMVGAAAAWFYGQFNWLLLFLALIGTILAHAGANAVADYFDFKKGVDSSRALSSHLGALAREMVEPETILLAAFACFLITALIGLVLVYLVGWPLLLFGIAGIMGAFFYTGRPVSYKYRGMGELTLGILMGPVIVMGSYYLHTQGWNWVVFLISIALAMLVTSVSLANNLRDLPDDKLAGILTLPMILGITGTKYLYYFLTVSPYLLIIGGIAFSHQLWPIVLVFISVPQAVKTIRALTSTGNDVNDIRQKSQLTPYPLYSIRLYTRFTILIIVGSIIAGFLVWVS
jgi:1,4-dihydroxy-2-naphthoate polyprenyltransferase